MKIKVEATRLKEQKDHCLIIGLFENGQLSSTAAILNEESHGSLAKLIKKAGFQGKIGQTLPIFNLNRTVYNHILLVGCGKKETTPTQFRNIIFAAIKSLEIYAVENAVCYLTDLSISNKSLPWKCKQIVEGMWDALYRFDYFKTKKEPAPALKQLTIHLQDKKEKPACDVAIKQGEAIGMGMTLTKNLANLPSNICTPHFLVDQAKILVKSYSKVTMQAFNEKQMQKMNMGAILGVSQGSAEDAYLIVIEYNGTSKKGAPIALVGKGITFDTGGNSLKTPDSMVGMKYDMSGGATVLGVIKSAAELALPIRLVGVIAAVENMPGGTAYKPEDILTSLSGQTIEVISTDAEGRLVLADALTYCERFKPEVVIDIATLTGAMVIALGTQTTGLLANDDILAKALLAAGTESNDRAWQLPLWEEYQEQLKSPFADMANTGGRAAGAIVAACFLSRFAKKFRWAHLDIAGTAGMGMGPNDRKATGRPVPLLVQYLINQAKQPR